MGCGEIARYLTRYGDGRVARVVMVAPLLPFALKTPDNPDGPIDPATLDGDARRLGDQLRRLAGAGRAAGVRPEGARRSGCAQTVQPMLRCSLQAAIECNVTGSQTDLRAELARIATPTLVLHGDADGSCPLEVTGRQAARADAELPAEGLSGRDAHPDRRAGRREMVDDILAFIGERGARRLNRRARSERSCPRGAGCRAAPRQAPRRARSAARATSAACRRCGARQSAVESFKRMDPRPRGRRPRRSGQPVAIDFTTARQVGSEAARTRGVVRRRRRGVRDASQLGERRLPPRASK